MLPRESVDVQAIERLLDYRVLLTDREVEACLAELEAQAAAELEAPPGSPRHALGLTLRQLIREYLAPRALARQRGWTAPLEAGAWPEVESPGW